MLGLQPRCEEFSEILDSLKYLGEFSADNLWEVYGAVFQSEYIGDKSGFKEDSDSWQVYADMKDRATRALIAKQQSQIDQLSSRLDKVLAHLDMQKPEKQQQHYKQQQQT